MRWKTYCLAGLFCMLPAVFSQTNLMKNPGFEEGIKHWGNWSPNGKWKIIQTDVKSGKKALHYAFSDPKGQGIIVNNLDLKPNTSYTVSCFLKGEADLFELKLFFWGKNNKYIGESAPFSGSSLKEWFHVKKVFTTPPETTRVQVGILVKNGYAVADDFSVVEGNVIRRAENELFNSSFRYSLRSDGMPDFWNAGGEYSYSTFQPGHAEGRFFRKAGDVKSPVPETDVLYYNKVGGFSLFPVPLASGEWYTFSLYVKGEKPGSKISLSLNEMTPGRKDFVVGTEWTRISLTAFLAKNKNVCSGRVNFYRNAFYIAAPMLEAGKTATKWRPNPKDATLPDLWAGRKSERKTGPPQIVCPVAPSWKSAGFLNVFFENETGKIEKGKFRTWFYVKDRILHIAIESDTGKKPFVRKRTEHPQEPGNEMAEVFLSPNSDGAPYWHFMGGRNGAFFAEKGIGGIKVNGNWSFFSKETPAGWRAEFTIPLSLIDLPGQKMWRMSLCASEFVKGKFFYYSSSGRNGYHRPSRFMYVKGLPVGGKTIESPARIAVEYDLYMQESGANVRIENMKFPVDLTVADRNGNMVYRKRLLEKTAEIPLSKLPPGYYRVEISHDGKRAESYFRKLPYRRHAARVDRFKQQIQVDEKPFFPMVFSWSGMSLPSRVPSPWHMKELRKRNFNTILLMPELYVDWIKSNSAELRKQVVKTFADAGFKIIVWGNGPKVFKGIQSMVDVRKRQIAELTAFDHAVIGWYFVDEIGPLWEKQFQLRERDFADGYRMLKEYAPYDLHFINWNWTGINRNQKFYASDGATDLYSIDCYPYSHGINFSALETFEKASETAGERSRLDFLPAIIWLQTYSYHEGLREPHQDEYRNNVYVGLINNLVGFMNFMGRPESNHLWDGMGEAYGSALKWLNMTAEKGSYLVKQGKEGTISYALWKNGKGGYALIAANTSYSAESAVLEFNVKFGKQPVPLGGKGTLTVEGNRLNVALPIAGSAAWLLK